MNQRWSVKRLGEKNEEKDKNSTLSTLLGLYSISLLEQITKLRERPEFHLLLYNKGYT